MFINRRDAATKLSTKLMDLYNKDVLILGISVGGMVVANELSKQLNVSSDMLVVRKLRVPEHRTEPMGAIASGGDTVYNRGIIRHFNVPQQIVDSVEREERQQLMVEETHFRGEGPAIDVAGKVVLLVDDGMSTGVTMRAAIDAVQAQSAREIIVASPVSSAQVCMMFHGIADRTVCFAIPQPFKSVDDWYENFEKPTDEEVRALIREGRAELVI